MEREEVWNAVHDTLAVGAAFGALRKVCRKLTEITQAAEDM